MHRIQAYVTLAILFVVGIMIFYLPIMIAKKKKGKSMIRQVGYLGLFCSLFLIVFATILFVPINLHNEKHILNLVPFDWMAEKNSIDHFIVEVVPNIMMFIPLGLFLPIVFEKNRKLLHSILVILLITFGIESVQYFIGRSSDVNDIIANLLGGMIGYFIFISSNMVLQKKKWYQHLLGC